MSAPHVSGMAALLLSQHPNGSSLRMRDVLAMLTKDAPMIGAHPLAWVSPTCAGTAEPALAPAPAQKQAPAPVVPIPTSAPAPTATPPTTGPPDTDIGGIPPPGSSSPLQTPSQV